VECTKKRKPICGMRSSNTTQSHSTNLQLEPAIKAGPQPDAQPDASPCSCYPFAIMSILDMREGLLKAYNGPSSQLPSSCKPCYYGFLIDRNSLPDKSLPHQNIVFVYKFSYKSNIIICAYLLNSISSP